MNFFELMWRRFTLAGLSRDEIAARLTLLKKQAVANGTLESLEQDKVDEETAQKLLAEMFSPEQLKLEEDQFSKLDKEQVAKQAALLAGHVLAERGMRERVDRRTFDLKKHDLVKGKGAWPHSYRKTNDDIKALDELFSWTRTLKDNTLLLYLSTAEGQVDSLYAARWADQAFPIVRLHGHKYAAALFSTGAKQGILFEAPWKAFLIEVPSGLVSLTDDCGELGDVRWVRVFRHALHRSPDGVGWSYCAVTEHGVQLRRINLLSEDLFDEVVAAEGKELEAFAIREDSRDVRAQILLSRLVVNVCLAMSDPDNCKPLHKNEGKNTNQRMEDQPIFRTFVLGKPVSVDCRPALKEFVEGTRRSTLSVQFLVRGHWRQQACGPAMSERKTIWIEPYWKGPEDAPINVRPHVLGTE